MNVDAGGGGGIRGDSTCSGAISLEVHMAGTIIQTGIPVWPCRVGSGRQGLVGGLGVSRQGRLEDCDAG